MVKVFIIHSGADYDLIKDHVMPFLQGEIDADGNEIPKEDQDNHASILTLESGSPMSWKTEANKKIKEAQVVVIVVGKDATAPAKNETMGWEVRRAEKYNKLMMVFNPDHNPIPKYLMHEDMFSKTSQEIAKQKTLQEIKQRIDDYDNGYYNVFSSIYDSLNEEEKSGRNSQLIDQYKMFQKSSEDLVTRRQNINSFYISVNSAIVALMGVLMGLFDIPTKMFVILFMSITGSILDISWIHILDAYGTLNAAKMKVITLIEKNMPVALYDAEWQIMSDKLNNKKYVSFTNSEKRIPRVFLFVYGIVIIFSIVFLLIHYFR